MFSCIYFSVWFNYGGLCVDSEVLFFVRVWAVCQGSLMCSVGEHSFSCQLRGYIVGCKG